MQNHRRWFQRLSGRRCGLLEMRWVCIKCLSEYCSCICCGIRRRWWWWIWNSNWWWTWKCTFVIKTFSRSDNNPTTKNAFTKLELESPTSLANFMQNFKYVLHIHHASVLTFDHLDDVFLHTCPLWLDKLDSAA